MFDSGLLYIFYVSTKHFGIEDIVIISVLTALSGNLSWGWV